MIYTISGILSGIAEKIATFSNRPVRISPTQQNTNLPCFYLCLMPGAIRDEIDNRYFSDINIDIVFLQQANITNATNGILEVLQNLDENLEFITYRENNTATPLYVYNRRHHLQDMDLHYQVTFHVRIMRSEVETFMRTMTEETHVKKAGN